MNKRKVLIVISLLLCLFLLLIGVIFIYVTASSSENVNAKIIKTVDDELVQIEEGWESYNISELDGYIDDIEVVSSEEGTKTVLLLGIDSRDDSLVGRSDSIILMRLNKENNIVKLVNVPRDSYVNIDGRGYDKINHAYAFGGSELSKKAMEDLFGLKIDHVASINFKSFEKVVDILGGVEVEVPFDFNGKTNSNKTVKFTKGSQLLSGEEALAYARMRKQDNEGDLGRGKRQQEVVSSILTEMKDASNVFKIKKLYGEVKENMETDVDLTDILDLLPHVKSLGNIEKYQLEGKPVMINGVSYFELNTDSLNDIRNELSE